MKTKSPLVLMEQLIMVAVFAIIAVICLRIFVLSDSISRRSAAVDRAVMEAQTVCEHIKRGSLSDYMEEKGGTYIDGTWQLSYDKAWVPLTSENAAAYHLSVLYEGSVDPNLWLASVSVSTAEGDELIALPISGQVWKGVTGGA